MVVRFRHDVEGVVLTEVAHPIKYFLVLICILAEMFPRPPLLHNAQEFNFVVSGGNELLDKAASNLLLNLANVLRLVDDLHTIACLLPTVHLVAILVR